MSSTRLRALERQAKHERADTRRQGRTNEPGGKTRTTGEIARGPRQQIAARAHAAQ